MTPKTASKRIIRSCGIGIGATIALSALLLIWATPACALPAVGPGWQGNDLANAFELQNRRGPDVHRRHSADRAQEVDSGTGLGNFLLTVPVISLPGRRLSLSLNLYYNSLVWQKMNIPACENFNCPQQSMVFDHDYDWPAPGWSLGFGKAVVAGVNGAIIEDSDEARHMCVANVGEQLGVAKFDGHTNDGTLVDCNFMFDRKFGYNWGIKSGSISYPEGTTVTYSAEDANGAAYPIAITDRNGNFITIAYVNNRGPAIETVRDTLGRVISFNYDSNLRLTSVTAPGMGGATRYVVRLNYAMVPPDAAFALPSIIRPHDYWMIGALYFPGDNSGYWFSYAAGLAMIQKLIEQRSMSFQTDSGNNQGTIISGVMTHEQEYHYSAPNVVSVPTYTSMTETWAGMDTPPAVTNYKITTPTPGLQEVATTYPDGTIGTQDIVINPGKFDDGLLVQNSISENGVTLKTVKTNWELGDYDSPRIHSVFVVTAAGRLGTLYSYGPRNSLTERDDLDYDGRTLRKIVTDYVDYPAYANRHVFNLPSRVRVVGEDGREASRTEYSYDQWPMAGTPGVVQNTWTAFPLNRAMVTQITRYVDAADATGRIVESLYYDVTGNLIKDAGPCCVLTQFSYKKETQYAFPSIISQGSVGDPTALVTASNTYDLSTGLVESSTNANNQTTRTIYDPVSLRSTSNILPTGAEIDYTYNDANMLVTRAIRTPIIPHCLNLACMALEAETTTYFNGMHLPYSVVTQGPNNISSDVYTMYDAFGRVSQRSQPYTIGSNAPRYWTMFSYDSLGRITLVHNPDGSSIARLYDEERRPSSASSARGETVRIVPSGRGDRWYRSDALGNLAEVVEPSAYANGPAGSVFNPDSVETSYSYNALGSLIHSMQGPNQQESDFQYDSLQRLTAELLPEKSATLNDTGTYVGSNAGEGEKWSDVFTYDDQSNLTSATDARGVRTAYEYNGDPLGRLRHVDYASAGPVAQNSTILPSPSLVYDYLTTGDVTSISRVSMVENNKTLGAQTYSYDPYGRVSSKQVSYTGYPNLELDYTKIDALNRLVEEIYPPEFGAQKSQARRKLDYSYGVGGQLKGLEVDGVDYASRLFYDPVTSQISSVTIGPSGSQQTMETYNYDPATGYLASQQVRRGSAPLRSLSYQIPYGGQLESATDVLNNGKYSYNYDALGRLWSAKESGGSDGAGWSETYAFDTFGNRTLVQASGSVDGSPIPPDGFASLTYNAKTNHITTAGFLYDDAGNQIRAQRVDGSWFRYEYDQAGRLGAVAADNGSVLESYAYGPDGRRVITRNSQFTDYGFWDGAKCITVYTRSPKGNGLLTWSLDRVYIGDRPLATLTSNRQSREAVYYHHYDRVGTQLITNNATDATIEQLTLPFGTLVGPSKAPVNPVFTNYDRSSITGLDYAINREYDSQERFTRVDPIGLWATNPTNPQSLNLYTYGRNDPINRVDTTGLFDTASDADQNCEPRTVQCSGGGSSGPTVGIADFAGPGWQRIDPEQEIFSSNIASATAGDDAAGPAVNSGDEPINNCVGIKMCTEIIFNEGEIILWINPFWFFRSWEFPAPAGAIEAAQRGSPGEIRAWPYDLPNYHPMPYPGPLASWKLINSLVAPMRNLKNYPNGDQFNSGGPFNPQGGASGGEEVIYPIEPDIEPPPLIP